MQYFKTLPRCRIQRHTSDFNETLCSFREKSILKCYITHSVCQKLVQNQKSVVWPFHQMQQLQLLKKDHINQTKPPRHAWCSIGSPSSSFCCVRAGGSWSLAALLPPCPGASQALKYFRQESRGEKVERKLSGGRTSVLSGCPEDRAAFPQ